MLHTVFQLSESLSTNVAQLKLNNWNTDYALDDGWDWNCCARSFHFPTAPSLPVTPSCHARKRFHPFLDANRTGACRGTDHEWGTGDIGTSGLNSMQAQ